MPACHFEIKQLSLGTYLAGREMCQHVTDLHRVVWESLPAEQKYFLIEKDEGDIRSTMSGPTTTLGITNGREIVAAAFLQAYSRYNPPCGLLAHHPIHVYLQAEATLKAGIISTVMVHPGFRGRGLMGTMVACLCAQAATQQQDVVIAKVAADNAPSRGCFMRAGFEIANTGIDANNGKSYYLVKRNISKNHPVAPRAARCSQGD